MDIPYWIYKDCFIFKPRFNSLIIDYLDIIKQHDKLIFSNYNNFKSSIKEINNHYDRKYTSSDFNLPLGNSLDKLTNLTHITFGDSFNQSLSNSLDKLTNLTHLTFGLNFNQPLSNSLAKLTNLTHLTFSWDFNQPLTNSLDQLTNLTHIIFCENFDQPLENILNKLINLTHLTLCCNFDQELTLHTNIKNLSLGCNNKNLIDNLPNSIEELYFDYWFNLPLNDLPSSIKKISFNVDSNYEHELNNLPRSLEQLELPTTYKWEIKNIPPNCKIIYL
jgi:hypothetical protein